MYSSISTWNKLCKKLDIDPKVLPSTDGMSKEDAQFTVGSYQAKKIADAVNMIDTENGVTNDPYYLPYFYRDGKGGFSFVATNGVPWGFPPRGRRLGCGLKRERVQSLRVKFT